MSPMREWRLLRNVLLFRLALVLTTLGTGAPAAVAQADAAAALARATRLLQSGDHRAAATLLEQSFEPGASGRADYLLGFARIQLYRFEEAEVSLRRAVEAEPDNVDRLQALAKSLLEQGKNLAAIEVLDQALMVERRPDLHFARAMCALNAGRPDRARSDLEATVLLQPGSAEALYKLGQMDVDAGDYASGKVRFEAALESDSSHLEARFLLGLAELRAGNAQASIAAMRMVLSQVPGHVGALYSLVKAYRLAGRGPEAEATLARFQTMSTAQDEADFLTKAVQRNPENVEGRLALVAKLLEIGLAGEALEHALAARHLAPRRREPYEALTKVFLRLGRNDEARRARDFLRRLEAES